jgi:hypothetical protein
VTRAAPRVSRVATKTVALLRGDPPATAARYAGRGVRCAAARRGLIRSGAIATWAHRWSGRPVREPGVVAA